MNKPRLIVCALALIAAIAYAQGAQEDPQPDSTVAEVSMETLAGYANGINVAILLLEEGFDAHKFDLDLNAMAEGMIDTFQNRKRKYTREQCLDALDEFEKKRVKTLREPGERFLASNAREPGVKTTESGLQYKIIREGTGPRPEATNRVTVHYTGTFIDGAVFDSSVERGEPATFALDQVIPGWTEGVQLMSIGAKYKLFIPYHLAYGEKGRPPVIPPYSTLVFEVELLEIE